MKLQAWGWLAAGVLAAGLNASYHDGGMEWAHRIADRVEHNTNAVLALATGRADRFLIEANQVTSRETPTSCRLAMAVAPVQAGISWSGAEFDRFQALSDREQARLEKLEARRARMQVQLSRVRMPAVILSPVVVSMPDVSACPRECSARATDQSSGNAGDSCRDAS
jgi:hypothetical protein